MKELDRLIEILCNERNEIAPSMSEEEKPLYFRALCNVRSPMAISDEFLTLEKIFLDAELKKRGVVCVKEFEYKDNIALWQGDITRLDSDAVVNACNSRLLGCFQPLHHCIDNCIHSYAGVKVRLDCNDIMQGNEEPNGKVRVTKAYNLPSKYIFHTVGPIVRNRVTEQNERDLESCYISCLEKAVELNLDTLAFCCLSTGVYGYPKDKACELAVSTVKNQLSKNNSKIKIIFNVFTDEDKKIYEKELGYL